MLYPALFFSLALLCGCGTSSNSRSGSISDIRSELDRRGCVIRMGDLAFDLETMVYYHKIEICHLDSVVTALPDSIATCPTTSSRYLIERTDQSQIVCPEGHGRIALIL